MAQFDALVLQIATSTCRVVWVILNLANGYYFSAALILIDLSFSLLLYLASSGQSLPPRLRRRHRLIAELFYETGIRRGELLKLKVDDLLTDDEGNCFISVIRPPDEPTDFVSNLSSRKELRQLVDAFRAHSDFPAESLATFEFIPGVAWASLVGAGPVATRAARLASRPWTCDWTPYCALRYEPGAKAKLGFLLLCTRSLQCVLNRYRLTVRCVITRVR